MEIRFTESDAAYPQQWNLADDRVLARFCEVFAMKVRTDHYSCGGDRWIATPADSCDFTGTRAEVVAFVRGYAIAWARQRAYARCLAQEALKDLNDKLSLVGKGT